VVELLGVNTIFPSTVCLILLRHFHKNASFRPDMLNYLNQNRCQKLFNRGLCSSAGGLFVCAGGAWHYKINQNFTYLWCFTFQFGGIGALFGGL